MYIKNFLIIHSKDFTVVNILQIVSKALVSLWLISLTSIIYFKFSFQWHILYDTLIQTLLCIVILFKSNHEIRDYMLSTYCIFTHFCIIMNLFVKGVARTRWRTTWTSGASWTSRAGYLPARRRCESPFKLWMCWSWMSLHLYVKWN